jgi:hypothetical protein
VQNQGIRAKKQTETILEICTRAASIGREKEEIPSRKRHYSETEHFDLPSNSEEEEEEEEEDTSSSGDTESGDTHSPQNFEAEDEYSDDSSESSITYCNITNTE